VCVVVYAAVCDVVPNAAIRQGVMHISVEVCVAVRVAVSAAVRVPVCAAVCCTPVRQDST